LSVTLKKNRSVEMVWLSVAAPKAARGQMQLVSAHILEARGVRRPAKKLREVLDPLHIVMLGLRRELRIVMSSIMRRRNGLIASSVMGMLLS
jgi:hypothetical protein